MAPKSPAPLYALRDGTPNSPPPPTSNNLIFLLYFSLFLKYLYTNSFCNTFILWHSITDRVGGDENISNTDILLTSFVSKREINFRTTTIRNGSLVQTPAGFPESEFKSNKSAPLSYIGKNLVQLPEYATTKYISIIWICRSFSGHARRPDGAGRQQVRPRGGEGRRNGPGIFKFKQYFHYLEKLALDN